MLSKLATLHLTLIAAFWLTSWVPAQNPNTVCATTATGTPPDAEVACENPCSTGCQATDYEAEGYTYRRCACGEFYSSACCNLSFGTDGEGGWAYVAFGACYSPTCGPGGICALGLEGGATVAVCSGEGE